MSRMEKRISIDFNSLMIHQLYTEIAPALMILEDKFNQKFEKLSSGVNEYVSLNPIKVIEKGEKYEIISGVSQYLKIFRKVGKINAIQILNPKYSIEAVIAADILTSDLHLWHPQALIIHAGVLSYLQKHPSVASRVEEMTWLRITPINDFLHSSSLIKRSVYYDLKQKHYSKPDEEKARPEADIVKASQTIAITGKLPMRMFIDAHNDALLSLSFDSENQFISAHIINSQTSTDITEQVRCLEKITHGIRLSISLDKDYVFEIYFLKHVDFIDDNSRLILILDGEKIKGRLFTNNQQKTVSCSEQGEITFKDCKTIIGKIAKDSHSYTFNHVNSNNKIVSSVNDVLIKPIIEVQS